VGDILTDKVPIKMSRTIYSKNGLVLKLNIRLKDEITDKSFHYETEYNNNTYLTLSPLVFLTISLIKSQNETYDPSKSIVITHANLFILIREMRRFVNNFYKKNLFANKGNHIIMYNDIANEVRTVIQLLGQNMQAIALNPTISNFDDVDYESVQMLLNNTSNEIILTIDEFESFLYILEQIDLFQYSQLLLNYFITYYKKDNVNKIPVNKSHKPKFNWADASNTIENDVKSTFSKSADDYNIPHMDELLGI